MGWARSELRAVMKVLCRLQDTVGLVLNSQGISRRCLMSLSAVRKISFRTSDEVSSHELNRYKLINVSRNSSLWLIVPLLWSASIALISSVFFMRASAIVSDESWGLITGFIFCFFRSVLPLNDFSGWDNLSAIALWYKLPIQKGHRWSASHSCCARLRTLVKMPLTFLSLGVDKECDLSSS